MPYLPEFLTIAAAFSLALMSPGPDFAMMMRNSIVYSRRTGVYAALGIALGILVHVAYSLLGIGLLIARSPALFNGVKILGAAYLVYIGWRSLRAKPRPLTADGPAERHLGRLAALRIGFFTNVLNPKATLFFLALFTQVIQHGTPFAVQVIYGVVLSMMAFLWFALVASLLGAHRVKLRLAKVQHRIEHAFGALLVIIGLTVAL